MNEPNAEPIVLTPEQRSDLGKVYQLILSWRQQRLQQEAESSTKEMEQPTPAPASLSSESEA
ncbi:MAG: hypothetical protein AB1649_16815 [Chloroflexota bacterium]